MGGAATARDAPFVAKFELESSGGLYQEMKAFQNTMLCAWQDNGQLGPLSVLVALVFGGLGVGG